MLALFNNQIRMERKHVKQPRKAVTMSGTQNVQNLQRSPVIAPGGAIPGHKSDANDTKAQANTIEGNGKEVEANGEDTGANGEDTGASETDFITKKLRNVGPRKLTRKETLLCDAIAKHIGESEPTNKEIPYIELGLNVRMALSPSIKGNLIQRGIFEAVYDAEHRLSAIKFTDAGFSLYKTRMDRIQSGEDVDDEPAERKPRQKGESFTRRSKFDVPGIKLRVMTDSNPRREGTHGYHSFELYKNGMSFSDYMKAHYDKSVKLKSTLRPWDGPRLDHFTWDLKEGNIALYNENEPETLPNGEPNPNYWVINNSGGMKKLREIMKKD